MKKIPKISRDHFYKKRGGSAVWLKIRCASCEDFLFLYQKDGPGNLHRLYLDRIFTPSIEGQGHSSQKTLYCQKCGATLASLVIYTKDSPHRLAYRLIKGSIRKEKLKSTT